jgi:putative NADH-flavin reductase
VRLTILGASGSVGRELVTQALAAGHEVTALVRDERAAGEIHGLAGLVVGDATSAERVTRAVEGSDAVLSTLGHAKRSPDDLLTRATTNVIAAMRVDGVERLVVLSSPAVADDADRPGLRYRAARALLRVVMPAVVRDHQAQARLIEASGLSWTIVRGPLLFTDGPRTGRYRAGALTRDSDIRIARADLAEFMLASATDGRFIGMRPLLSR